MDQLTRRSRTVRVRENLVRLTRASWFYSLLTMAGLGAGALREMLIARNYGVGVELDAYAAVLCIYHFLGTQIGAGLETAFVARYAHRSGTALSERLLSSLTGSLAVLLLLLVVLVIGGGFIFGRIFGFDGFQLHLATSLLTVFLPAIVLCGLIGIPRAALYIRGRYAAGLSYGAIISCSVIVSIVLGSHTIGIYALAVGYLLGNVIAIGLVWTQIRIALPRSKEGSLIAVSRAARNQPFDLLQSAVLVLIVEVLYQFGNISERGFAAQNGAGTLSAYFYATSLMMVFSALVIQPVSTVVFPRISRAYKENRVQARRFVLQLVSGLFVSSLIIAIGMYLLGDGIVRLWFVRGKFTPEDGLMTADIFEILVFTLPFMSISRVLKNSIYADGNFRFPILTNAARWGVLLLLASLLMPSMGIRGVAIASVAATATDTLLMLVFFLLTPNGKRGSPV